MTTKKPLSREDVLSGLGGRMAKQASIVLTLIENRTARCLVESQQAAARFTTATTDTERAQAYLAALAQGRDRSYQPTIRDLERYAPQWAELVPENPVVRAIVAHLLGEKYRFTGRVSGGIGAALGLTTPTVQAAYQQHYGQPLSNIYAPRLRPTEQMRWGWARVAGWLENRSPFWTAYAMTLTNTVGSSVLALPIALAGVGPLAAVAILLVLGFVNLLTMAYMAEVFTRTGSVRYDKGFVGRVVADYLGSTAALILSVATLFYCVLSLCAYYIGFATTLAAATPLPAWLWAGLLFAAGLYLMGRDSLNATVASALVIGAVNIGLILLLSILALRWAQPANLFYVNLPWLNGKPFDPLILRLLLGVVLGIYSGQLSVSNCARVVLQRDPSGRSLLQGATLALLTSMLLFCLWVVAVNGAVSPAVLARETGTALIPLAYKVGPLVHFLGAIYVFLAIGMISIHASLGLVNLTREWLPADRFLLRLGKMGWGKRVYSVLLFAPMTLVFLLAEWLLLTGVGSFTQINSLRGVLMAPLVAGIFPALLLVAGRRKGEIAPGVVYSWLGRSWLVWGIYGLFLSSIFLHGLVIWTNPLQRALALAVGLLLLGMTVWVVRRGAFARRIVIEVRQTEKKADYLYLAVMAEGKPQAVTAYLGYDTGEEKVATTNTAIDPSMPPLTALLYVRFALPALSASDVKVWAHQLTRLGESIGLTGEVILCNADATSAGTWQLVGGQIIFPWLGAACTVEIRLDKPQINKK